VNIFNILNIFNGVDESDNENYGERNRRIEE
jgi:hypothetical protein